MAGSQQRAKLAVVQSVLYSVELHLSPVVKISCANELTVRPFKIVQLKKLEEPNIESHPDAAVLVFAALELILNRPPRSSP